MRSASAARWCPGLEIGNKQQRALEARREAAGLRLRHADRRLARQARQHAAAVDGARRGPDPARCLQQRRLCRRPGREQQGGDHHPRALSGRLDAGGPGAAPAAGVFLHLRLAAGHHPPPHAAIWRGAFAGRQGGDPAQRHASRRSPWPSSCASSSTITASTGTRPGRSPRAASATPTTRCCPRRWKAGRCTCSSMCCRATCRSSTRSTPSSSPMRRSGRTARREFLASVSLIDEHNGRRVRMGQLAFAGSHSINGVSALHTSLMKQSVFRDLNTLYPGPHQQQDQRHHAAALAAGRQSAACGTAEREHRAIGARRCRRACRRPRASPTTRAFRERFAAIKRAQQGRARQPHRARAWASRSIPPPCSTCRSSASTNTSASC